MTLTAIEEYYSSNTHKPFYVAVGSDEYKELKMNLEELGTDFIRVSDCCRGQDKKPDLDLLREKLRTADVDCKSNRVVVIGLAEYLMLEGDYYAYTVYEEFKEFNLGSAWAVFLLHGGAHNVTKIGGSDPRFDNRRFYVSHVSSVVELDLFVSPTSISMFSIHGVKNLLHALEDGQEGEICYNSDVLFPDAACRIREIKDSYEAIKRQNKGFNIPKSIGEEYRWDYLLEEISEHGTLYNVFEVHRFNENSDRDFYSRIAGTADACWLYYLYLQVESKEIKNSYLKYILESSIDFCDFKYKIVNEIIEIPHTDSRFNKFYADRKKLLKGYPEAEIAQFVVNNRKKLSESVYKLTDNSSVERKEIISLISQHGIPESIGEIYPDLNMYLSKYSFQGDALSKELTEYFEAYKRQKIRNCIESDFMEKVKAYATSRDYNRLRTRDELIATVDKNSTFLCWIDALGAEYLSYIVNGAQKRGLIVSVKIGRANLPTITTVNNQFYYDWPEVHREKIEELDDVKHKDKGGYRYGPDNKYPIHLAEELRILSDALDRAATELALRHYDKYIIASDHGASRLAVISEIEEKYETDTRGKHSGRCCKIFKNYELPFATEENGFVILANYGRFKGSRAANVEVHGGATLEEVIVPVIELSLADNSIHIALSDENVISDYKAGAEFCLFVNKTVSSDLSVCVEGERFRANKVDENHYMVYASVMKRAKTYGVDIYVGENLITKIDITTRGKSASVNTDFDDLF